MNVGAASLLALLGVLAAAAATLDSIRHVVEAS
jgi:hypothetical protein